MIRKISKSGVLYILPALIIVAVVMLYPLIYTLTTGFSENTLFMERPVFNGLANYKELFSDEVFLMSVKNTFIWTLGSVVLQFALGFAMALILHQAFIKGKTVLRILLMIPWVTPSIVGSSIWKWMYNADYGVINYFLRSLHIIDSNQTWLADPQTAMRAVIVVNVWKMFPYVMLMIEASLQGVSKDLKEAAVVDGAGNWKIFKNVTWPAIAHQCYSILLLLTVWTLNSFTFIYNLTEGGPAHRTEVLSMYIFRQAFTNYDFGYASAASTVLFILCMVVAFVYMRFTREKD